MARRAAGHAVVNHKPSPAGIVPVAASGGTAHVVLEIDDVSIMTMSELRVVVAELLKWYEGQLKP